MGRTRFPDDTVIGYIGRWPSGGSAMPRWALFRTDGTRQTFDDSATRDDVERTLAAMGLHLRADDKVERVPAEGGQHVGAEPHA